MYPQRYNCLTVAPPTPAGHQAAMGDYGDSARSGQPSAEESYVLEEYQQKVAAAHALLRLFIGFIPAGPTRPTRPGPTQAWHLEATGSRSNWLTASSALP